MRCAGIRINAFDVRGDPREFPKELRTMSKQHESDALLYPWRGQSDYSSMLFWKTLSKLSIPVALVVSKTTRATEGVGRVGVVGGSGNTSTLHSSGAGDVEMPAPTRVRQNSLDGSAIELTTFVAGAGGMQHRGRSTSVPEAFGRGRATSVAENLNRIMTIEAFNYDVENTADAATGAGSTGVIKEVLCVVSGQPVDRALLALMARVVEHNSVHLLVVVTADKADFPEVRRFHFVLGCSA